MVKHVQLNEQTSRSQDSCNFYDTDNTIKRRIAFIPLIQDESDVLPPMGERDFSLPAEDFELPPSGQESSYNDRERHASTCDASQYNAIRGTCQKACCH